MVILFVAILKGTNFSLQKVLSVVVVVLKVNFLEKNEV